MNLRRFTRTGLILHITCADKEALIKALTHKMIRLTDIKNIDDLTFRVTVNRSDLANVQKIAEKNGASIKIFSKVGFLWSIMAILNRPVLVIFLLAVIAASSFISSRILFISVEGNSYISEKYILEAAESCGLQFGTIRRNVRSEVIKNALLERVPQLQWVGVNTKGCVATISVREKTEIETESLVSKEVCSIVAIRDGIIQQCTVYQGNALCTVGQAVKAGQILVSAYTGSDKITKATRADAEIYAVTNRNLNICSIKPTAQRGKLLKIKSNYALRIGKNTIKLYKDSGNLGAICAKIYSEKSLKLPGGFYLPVAIVKETDYVYDDAELFAGNTEDGNWIEDWGNHYLQSVMIAGKRLSSQTTLDSTEDCYTLYGAYTCLEMIGQIKYEQTILEDVRND